MLIQFLSEHPEHLVNGTPFKDWLKWETDLDHKQYIIAMQRGEWGGALEMAIFNAVTKAAISVWAIENNRLRRITHIDGDDRPHCHIVYMNKNHYGVVADS